MHQHGECYRLWDLSCWKLVLAVLLKYQRRNGEWRRLRNINTAKGVTECGHQPAVILVKLMFCRGGVQHFLLRRTLYPVFHSQWSCVSFPSQRFCGHNLVTLHCEASETEKKETQRGKFCMSAKTVYYITKKLPKVWLETMSLMYPVNCCLVRINNWALYSKCHLVKSCHSIICCPEKIGRLSK